MTEEADATQTVDIAGKLDSSLKKKKCIAASLVVILLVTFLAYLPTLKNDFIFLDDDSHLLENHTVRALDAKHIYQMFTTTVNKVYLPLTLLSFAVEHHFFKYTPFIYHFNNLLLHLAVTALVFYFGLQIGLPLRAVFIASLFFGIHPMHVESVSWVTERKDVLYSFFYMIALCLYWQYLTRRKMFFYVAAIISGILSILAKPMALSLPLVLFICDWLKGRRIDRAMFLDKIPHFIYAVSIAWVTYSLNSRIPGESIYSGALIWVYTCVFYIRQFFLPLILVPMYALPEPIALTNPHYAGSIGLFILMGLFLFRLRRHRWVMFAAAYYFLSIFFLLRYDNIADKNIVADRFMYLPGLGICFLVGYAIDRVFGKLRGKLKLFQWVLIVFLLFPAGWLGKKTFEQTKIWRASVPFWTHVLKYYPENAMAYGNRGEAYRGQGKYDLAMADFNASIMVDPKYAESYNSRGQMYGMSGRTGLALEDFKKAIELRPNFDEAYNNIGVIYSIKEEPEKAITYFEKAIGINPYNNDARYNAGDYYYKKGEFDPAFENFQKILEIDRTSSIAYNKRGLIYGIRKDYDRSLKDLDRALALDPGNSEIYKNRGIIFEHMKDLEAAIENYNKAIEINPRFADAYCFRGNTYAQMGQYGDAAKDFAKALEIDPEHFNARKSQNALIERLTGQKPQAINVQDIIREEREKRLRTIDLQKEMEEMSEQLEGAGK